MRHLLRINPENNDSIWKKLYHPIADNATLTYNITKYINKFGLKINEASNMTTFDKWDNFNMINYFTYSNIVVLEALLHEQAHPKKYSNNTVW